MSWRGDSKYLFGDRRSITAVSAGCSGVVVLLLSVVGVTH